MVFRCILPAWKAAGSPSDRKVLEGEFSPEQIAQYNAHGYNIYFLPNYPSLFEPGKPVDGSNIDTFEYVFVDMDLKDGVYADKDAFLVTLGELAPSMTQIVDSGNGIHVYWRVTDLDAMSFLKLQRRLCRLLKTDEAVCKIYQLMRYPGTSNTKHEGAPKQCEVIYATDVAYTCEDLDRLLPAITLADAAYCQNHYDKTYKIGGTVEVDEKIPLKFAKLLDSNKEVKDIWTGNTDDRSKADYRLGHIMFASSFTREEALSVLVNTGKALARAPSHRVAYAENIVDKIWTYEMAQDKTALTLSSSVKDILSKSGGSLKGTRFPCWDYLDDTSHGFRLGQVIGLVAGVGVGKTALALNMFMGFVQNNPDYDHIFVALEQPKEEIADRWRTMCGEQSHLHDKVQVLSNYAEDGSFHHLSLNQIKEYILKYQTVTGRKIGCVVIDHIGVLKKESKDGENQGLMDICHEMKAFAIHTNSLLVMQSQAPREKSGIGDLELDKDAAYGTVFFEAYCDYLVTMWQPLKRCYSQDGCPTLTAFKFCKIRHKKQGADRIQEDVPYILSFDPGNQRLTKMTQDQETQLKFYLNIATNLRKKDRKTDLVQYTTIKTEEEQPNGKVGNRQNSGAA